MPYTTPEVGILAVTTEARPTLSIYEKRAIEIRQLVDPHNTLPHIKLQLDTEASEALRIAELGPTKYVAYDEAGQQVGVINTKHPHHRGLTIKEKTQVAWVHTNRPGQGYGMAMYLNIITANVGQGIVVENDPTGVSPSAKRG